jgi:23S rRNA (pseudouridine1915-N3)-methyltransferase
MKIKLIAVGKLKSQGIAVMVEDYAKRIERYSPFEMSVVKDEGSVKIDRDDFLVVLDERGEETTSKGLSEFLENHRRMGTKRLTFFVGDAPGVSETIKAKAKTLMSLSRMTFPHELARAILLEQLYRACTILRGEKYHYG